MHSGVLNSFQVKKPSLDYLHFILVRYNDFYSFMHVMSLYPDTFTWSLLWLPNQGSHFIMRFNSHNRSCLQVNCLADALFICLLSGLSLNEYACSVHPLFYYKYICSVLKIAAPYLNHARTEEYFVAALKQLLILLRRNYTFTGEVPQFDGASSLNSSYFSMHQTKRDDT